MGNAEPERKRTKPKGSGRRTKLTKARRKTFLRHLGRTRNVSSASQACGVSTSILYKLRQKSKAFARDWDNALESYKEVIEQAMHDRAIEGVDEPVFYRGQVVGHIKRFSDVLLLARAKAYIPERYQPDGQSTQINIQIGQRAKIIGEILEQLPPRTKALPVRPGGPRTLPAPERS